MFNSDSPQVTPETVVWSREGPKVQAFVARHRPFFVLVGTLVAQLLLLSFQITRNHNVRLIQVWAVAIFDPFERGLHDLFENSSRAWGTYRSLWRAHQQNQELHAQLLVARSQLQQLSEQAGETQRLRALLELKTHLPLQTV